MFTPFRDVQPGVESGTTGRPILGSFFENSSFNFETTLLGMPKGRWYWPKSKSSPTPRARLAVVPVVVLRLCEALYAAIVPPEDLDTRPYFRGIRGGRMRGWSKMRGWVTRMRFAISSCATSAGFSAATKSPSRRDHNRHVAMH